MLPKLREVEYRRDYCIWLKFADGVEGEVDLESELWGEVFEPLKETNPDSQTLRWIRNSKPLSGPNGADFAPEFLYQKLCPNYALKPMLKSGAA